MNKAYYVSDSMGSVRAALDAWGHVAETWNYDAFGLAYEDRFGDAYRYGYTGKAYDNVTGAYNYGFLDYDPSLGRFTSVDPIWDGTNWYAYCSSDPMNFVDLWGLDPAPINWAQELLEIFVSMENSSNLTEMQEKVLDTMEESALYLLGNLLRESDIPGASSYLDDWNQKLSDFNEWLETLNEDLLVDIESDASDAWSRHYQAFADAYLAEQGNETTCLKYQD